MTRLATWEIFLKVFPGCSFPDPVLCLNSIQFKLLEQILIFLFFFFLSPQGVSASLPTPKALVSFNGKLM